MRKEVYILKIRRKYRHEDIYPKGDTTCLMHAGKQVDRFLPLSFLPIDARGNRPWDIPLIDVIMRSMLSTYLDFLGKGYNIVFIQLHDPVYIYLGSAIHMGIGDCIAVGIEFLCIRGGLLA